MLDVRILFVGTIFSLLIILESVSGAPDFWSALCRRMPKSPLCQSQPPKPKPSTEQQPTTTAAPQSDKSRKKYFDYRLKSKVGSPPNQFMTKKDDGGANDYDGSEDNTIDQQQQENRESNGQGSNAGGDTVEDDSEDGGAGEDYTFPKVNMASKPPKQPSNTQMSNNKKPPRMPPSPPLNPPSPRKPTTFAPVPTIGFKGDPLTGGLGGGGGNGGFFGAAGWGNGKGGGPVVNNGMGGGGLKNNNNNKNNDKDDEGEDDAAGGNDEDENDSSSRNRGRGKGKKDDDDEDDGDEPDISSFSSISKWCRKNKSEYKSSCQKKTYSDSKEFCSKYGRICSFLRAVNHVPIQFGFSVNV